MKSIEDRIFSEEALRCSYLSREQVDAVIRLQSKLIDRGFRSRSISELLLAEGQLSRYLVKTIYRNIAKELDLPQVEGYHLVAKIGEGATGSVYEGRQQNLDRKVAIKILDPVLQEDPEYLARFYREARSVARLNHPHVVGGFDVGADNGVHYFVMEYVEGETLKDRVSKSGLLGQKEVVRLARQMAEALGHAHEHGILHRDIKPANILLDQDGQSHLCDLGLARPADLDARLTRTGVTHGTPHYMSPEQAVGEDDLDGRSDLYSLGATLYFAVTGQAPFLGGSLGAILVAHLQRPLVPPLRLNPNLSPVMDRVIRKLLEKNPEHRYTDCGQLIGDLLRIEQGEMDTVDIPLSFEKGTKEGIHRIRDRLLLVSIVLHLCLLPFWYFRGESQNASNLRAIGPASDARGVDLPRVSELAPLPKSPLEFEPALDPTDGEERLGKGEMSETVGKEESTLGEEFWKSMVVDLQEFLDGTLSEYSGGREESKTKSSPEPEPQITQEEDLVLSLSEGDAKSLEKEILPLLQKRSFLNAITFLESAPQLRRWIYREDVLAMEAVLLQATREIHSKVGRRESFLLREGTKFEGRIVGCTRDQLNLEVRTGVELGIGVYRLATTHLMRWAGVGEQSANRALFLLADGEYKRSLRVLPSADVSSVRLRRLLLHLMRFREEREAKEVFEQAETKKNQGDLRGACLLLEQLINKYSGTVFMRTRGSEVRGWRADLIEDRERMDQVSSRVHGKVRIDSNRAVEVNVTRGKWGKEERTRGEQKELEWVELDRRGLLPGVIASRTGRWRLHSSGWTGEPVSFLAHRLRLQGHVSFQIVVNPIHSNFLSLHIAIGYRASGSFLRGYVLETHKKEIRVGIELRREGKVVSRVEKVVPRPELSRMQAHRLTLETNPTKNVAVFSWGSERIEFPLEDENAGSGLAVLWVGSHPVRIMEMILRGHLGKEWWCSDEDFPVKSE